MSTLNKINIIPIIFILNIISSFLDNYSLSYASIIFSLIVLFYKIINYKLDKHKIHIKSVQLIICTIFYIILVTVINCFFKNEFYNVVKSVLLILPLTLGTLLVVYFGKDYFYDGLIKISNLMTIINIYGLIEFFYKENFLVEFMVSDRTRQIVNAFIHTSNYRTSTVFTNPIIYGNLLVIFWWINLYLLKNHKLKILNYILILVNLYATRSRSAWLTFFITIIIYLFVIVFRNIKINNGINNKVIIKIMTILFIFLALINIPQVQQVINSIMSRFYELNSIEGSVSATQRLGSINVVLDGVYNGSIRSFILGNGFGSSLDYMMGITVVLVGFNTTDNQYLSVLLDFGIVGLILISACILVPLFAEIRNDYNRSLCIIFIIISISICMYFYEIAYWPIISQLLFICVGAQSIRDKCVNK